MARIDDLRADFLAKVKPALASFIMDNFPASGAKITRSKINNALSEGRGWTADVDDGAGGTIPNPVAKSDHFIYTQLFNFLIREHKAGSKVVKENANSTAGDDMDDEN